MIGFAVIALSLTCMFKNPLRNTNLNQMTNAYYMGESREFINHFNYLDRRIKTRSALPNKRNMLRI